jgi:hypothetical protein
VTTATDRGKIYQPKSTPHRASVTLIKPKTTSFASARTVSDFNSLVESSGKSKTVAAVQLPAEWMDFSE